MAYSDLPDEFKEAVNDVFDTEGCLPAEWLDKSSKFHRRLKATSSTEFVQFMTRAQKEHPRLFSKSLRASSNCRLLDELKAVFFSWEHLRKMRSASDDKVSEADFVSNVYEGLRSSALQKATYKSKWPISLPQPSSSRQIRSQSIRILNAKSVVPDGVVFVPEDATRKLSHAAESAFKQLRRSSLTGSAVRGGESFATQSTPCVQLPRTPGFQFASTFWEDKKPVHSLLEDAYRQNRMATAAAVRHLHSLHVKAPVFGFVWSDGTVRAHVDWCVGRGERPPIVRSALFPGPNGHVGCNEGHAYEWDLDKPGGILDLFLVLKKIDHWTTSGFLERIEVGIADLLKSVLNDGSPYQPWKRVGTFKAQKAKEAHATENSSSQPSAQPSIAYNTRARRRARKS